MNDAANRPEQLRDLVGDIKSNLTIMAPNDELGGNVEYLNGSKALAFGVRNTMKGYHNPRYHNWFGRFEKKL